MALSSEHRFWVYCLQRNCNRLSGPQRRRYERKKARDERREAARAIESAAAERAAEVVSRADARRTEGGA